MFGSRLALIFTLMLLACTVRLIAVMIIFVLMQCALVHVCKLLSSVCVCVYLHVIDIVCVFTR